MLIYSPNTELPQSRMTYFLLQSGMPVMLHVPQCDGSQEQGASIFLPFLREKCLSGIYQTLFEV